MGRNVDQLRLELNLDTPFAVRPYAKRPVCSRKGCGRSVVGHSYNHTAEGVVCHRCLYGPRRLSLEGHGVVSLAAQNKAEHWFASGIGNTRRIESDVSLILSD